jgi:tRNA pseudouridine55 synthase
MFGVINVYKPRGLTSHDVVGIIRKLLKIKQVGHTGTLDPFAEGVLPICIGKATRLIEYLNDDKAYIGTVQFGLSTTTYDTEGDVVSRSDKKVNKKDVEEALKSFRGEIEQTPPIYSAIKVNGKKLYEYAREGKDVKIQPRKVNISKLELLTFDEENQTAELMIECSKGTYIRSIANDLGKKLECYGHLIKLVRTKAGNFEVKNSIILENIDSIETVNKNLLSPINFINHPKIEITTEQMERISHGNNIVLNSKNGTCVLIFDNKIIAIGETFNNNFKCKKVFI